MIENIKERKKQIAEYYEIEYAPKPQKWWWAKPGEKYENVRDVYKRKGDPGHDAIEVIIRNYKTRAAVSAALFFVFTLPVFISLKAGTWKAENAVIWFLFVSAITIDSVYKAYDRRPKIVLDDHGLYTLKWKGYVRWKNIAAVYIKEDNSGDSTSYYLVVHFYDADADEFLKEEIGLNGLEKSPDDIACITHYFLSIHSDDSRTEEQASIHTGRETCLENLSSK